MGDASPRRRIALELLAVVAVKALAGAAVWASGFRAVSDDDFARIALAQRFAAEPRLDPTGSSWLPFPFWLQGGAMWLAGDDGIGVARAVSFALGLASAALIYAAARLLVPDGRAALYGALVAAVFPWSARLGVATVPELPVAALSLFAVATLASPRGSLRIAGGLCLLAACLSRYEPWSLAAGFVALTWIGRRVDVRAALVASGLAALGPAAWMLHNARAHGDALHFLARVSAYKRAVAGSSAAANLEAAFAYPAALLREEPELWIGAAFALALAVARGSRGPSRWTRPLLAVGVMVCALSLAASRGGAPTHHSGRAVLVVWLAVAVYLGAELWRSAAALPRRPALALVVVAAIPLGSLVLRPWYSRLDAMADREAEVAIGRAARELPRDARILLAVEDFGFFAVKAGCGWPDRFILDREHGPLSESAPSSFSSEAALARRIASSGATHVIGHPGVATAPLGTPLASAGPWSLWAVR